ncbi:hypothetical protein LIA77_10540 [Sarocladium implicatum]|nr:hypothetical protein LIA77_10540 [Sarocladium implicatum]
MRVSALVSVLFVAVAAARTIPSELESGLVKRCQCVCSEVACQGPPCCANGSCKPNECENDHGFKFA